MNTFAQKSNESQTRAAIDRQVQGDGAARSPLQLADERLPTGTPRALDENLNGSAKVQSQLQLGQMLNQSPRVTAQMKLAETLSGHSRAQQPSQQPLQREQASEEEEISQPQTSFDEEPLQSEAMPDEEEPMQSKSEPVQKKENQTGLPDKLKAGVENLSGLAMDDVRVHYNSAKPATVQALAYTQGTEIHVGPGQEKHLAHEAWHVAQQKQGRVKPTLQLRGMAVNDDESLEAEATAMGEKAAYLNAPDHQGSLAQRVGEPEAGEAKESAPLQRAVGFEFQTYHSPTDLEIYKDKKWEPYTDDTEERYAQGNGVKVEKDGSDLEFVTDAFAESDAGRASLTQAMRTIILTGLGLENTVTLTTNIWKEAPGLSKGPNASDNVRVSSKGPMKAQPQATVGVKLDSLTELLSFLSQSPKRQSSTNLAELYEKEVSQPEERVKKATGKHKLAYHKVLAAELGHNVNDETQKFFHGYVYGMAQKLSELAKAPRSMQGFVNLLGLYIFGGITKSKYAKSRTPIISRTNLADVFAKLPKKDQAWFIKDFLPAATKFLDEHKIKIAGPVYPSYPHGEREAVGLEEEDVMKKTILEWLTNLAPEDLGGKGIDILSDLEGLGVIANANKVKNPDPEDYRQKWFTDVYGADLQMQESTDVGTRERLDKVGVSAHRLEGIVLELRNLGDDQLDLSEWASFAISLFDLIVLVNSSNMKEVKALSEAMMKQRSFETDLGDLPTPGIFAQAREILSKQK